MSALVSLGPFAAGKQFGQLNGKQAGLPVLDEENEDETKGRSSSSSTSSSSSSDTKGSQEDVSLQEAKHEAAGKAAAIKCSAVHTLERSMPDFDYSHLVQKLRHLLLEEFKENPHAYSSGDRLKCEQDDWFLARYLLRQKLDVDLALDMMKKSMRFHNEMLYNYFRPADFPRVFYQIAAIFNYETDRKGNRMLYIRGKIHKKIHEITEIIQSFLYYNLKKLDDEVNGKGISIVFDCSGAGIANADMDILLFLFTTLFNYFPKGISYLLVHELPWILKPIWYIVRGWLSEEHQEMVKFSNGRTILEYVNRESLPDFMGGTCKRDYRAIPEDCSDLRQAAKLWGIELSVARRIVSKFEEHLPEEVRDELRKLLEAEE